MIRESLSYILGLAMHRDASGAFRPSCTSGHLAADLSLGELACDPLCVAWLPPETDAEVFMAEVWGSRTGHEGRTHRHLRATAASLLAAWAPGAEIEPERVLLACGRRVRPDLHVEANGEHSTVTPHAWGHMTRSAWRRPPFMPPDEDDLRAARRDYDSMLRSERAFRPEALSRLRQRFPWLPAEIDCGPGWESLISSLCTRIAAEVHSAGFPTREVLVTRVAEEKGRLVFRVQGIEEVPFLADRIRDLVAEAVARSCVTCEVCGGDGDLHLVLSEWRATCLAHRAPDSGRTFFEDFRETGRRRRGARPERRGRAAAAGALERAGRVA